MNLSHFRISFFVLLTVVLTSFVNADTEFYVSPSGNDANPGTLEQPFQTLTRARDAVRSLKKHSDIIVYLREGVYALTETLVFDQRDSGEKKSRVIYQAYPNEIPIISGGVRLTGWQPAENGLWRAPAKGMIFRQLYVNGARAIRARTPNSGDYYRLNLWDLASKTLWVAAEQVQSWENLQDVEMIVQMNWAESCLRLESVAWTNGATSNWVRPSYAKITPQEPERHLIFARDYPPKHANQPYHFENAKAFIDTPGEWYLDRQSNVVWYLPRPRENLIHAEVIVPHLETLVMIKGTLEQPVQNLTFAGIRFAYSTWLRPSEFGHLHLQAGQYTIDPTQANVQYVGRPGAAVLVEAAHHIEFRRNVFTNLGATALDLHYGTLETQVTGNVICNISGNGISVAKFSDPEQKIHVPYNPADPREICQNDVIANNLVTNIGCDFPGSVGITCGYSVGTKIDHNEIAYTPYSGISVGWGWTDKPSVMRDNKIRWNDIHHVMQSLIDCGGIYTLSLQPGTELLENYIHDCTISPWAGESPFSGIYLDEKSGGTLERPMIIRRNLVTSGALQRYHMHISGITLWDYNQNYLNFQGQDVSSQIVKKAGLEAEYRDIKSCPQRLEDETTL